MLLLKSLGAVGRRHEVAKPLGGKPAGEEVAQPLGLAYPAAAVAASLCLAAYQPAPLPPPVVPGPGAAAGACHHGAGASGQRPRHLPPGCHALPAGLLLG